MNDLSSPPSASDTIDEDKRLIRQGGDKGLSLSERITERFHRLTWRTPVYGMQLRGRHPLKLIAVPDDPIFGDVNRGHALLDGQLTLLGETIAIDALDLTRHNFSRRFAEYLHGFVWLRDLSTVATRAQGAPIAERLMRLWLAQHADTVSEPAWRPDLAAQRILFWASHAPLILSSTDLVYRSKVLNTLARTARHLDRGAEKAPLGLPRIAAWAGVTAAGLLIPGGDPRRFRGEAGLTKALAASVSEDGGVVSRHPGHQLETIGMLTMLAETYAARRIEPPAVVATVLSRMVPALLGVVHGDGGLASWQGGGPLRAEAVEATVAASRVRARPLRQARDWGYQRLAAGSTVLIVDAAPPPVARMTDGGCASTLAFEMSDGADRLVVNCGGARAAMASIPQVVADGLRTTAAHSTLTTADSNSTAILTSGALGRGVVEIELTRQESEGASRLEASHDGYVRRFGLAHRRQLVLTADGREVRGEDMLLPQGRKRARGAVPFAVRFHLGPGVDASPTTDGMAALLRLPGGSAWQFRCRGGALAIDESLWIGPDGRPRSTLQLVVAGEAPAGGATVGWALKRAT